MPLRPQNPHYRLHFNRDQHTSLSGHLCSQGCCPLCHQPNQYLPHQSCPPWHFIKHPQHLCQCHPHQSHHLQHHPNPLAKPIPKVDGHPCLLTFRPPCSCI